MKLFIAMFLLLIVGPASGQSTNFALIDRYVLTVEDSSVEKLARKLMKPCKTEKEKVRAIFRWVAENVAYDVEGYHNKNKMYGALPESKEFSTYEEFKK
jgi:hypothetical protein